jgi:2-isopropylmalate synthase
VFEYSPESFHGTELELALEICEAVAATWGPTADDKMIVNLPTTVEAFPPNVYADRLEWFQRRFSAREAIVLSVHPHNDRGTAVATAELGLMAGADRVEGTLFGNGERTGNVDLITLALNLLTQGVDPNLDLSALDEAKRIVEECNELLVHPRHPWVGELVYTAFSGSHQDAIKKGMYAQQRSESELWDVPYLPIDPQDLGRSYEAIIRVNSQSGKGGVAYLMETEHHLELPRGLQVDFAQKVQAVTDLRGGELTPDELLALFHEHYLAQTTPYELVSYTHSSADEDRIVAELTVDGEPRTIEGVGNGPIAALVDALARGCNVEISLREYHEHALSAAADATAAAYIEADVDDEPVWGVGLHPSIVNASLRAVVNAVNRAAVQRQLVLGAAAARRE